MYKKERKTHYVAIRYVNLFLLYLGNYQGCY